MVEENENFIHNKYGYCYYEIKDNNTALIFNLYVESEFRRKGHARHLIQLVKNELKEYKELQIKAEPYEDSISIDNLVSFYESMGLKVINKK